MEKDFTFYILYYTGLPSCFLRFGKSLARLRTQFREKVRRDAKRVIRANMKQTSKGYNHKVSYKWIQWANLQPVFDCLM